MHLTFDEVVVNTILLGRDNHGILVIIEKEEFRLSGDWLEFGDVLDIACLKIEFQDAIFFSKYDRIYFMISRLWDLEVKLHTNLLHLFIIDEHYLLYEHKFFISFYSLVNEQLIGLLLVHDQVLSANDGEIFIIVTRCHCNYFVDFSGGGGQKLDFDLIVYQLLECAGIIHPYGVQITNDESTLTLYAYSKGTLQVVFHHSNHEIMLISSSVDFKVFLVCFVGYTISYLAAEHHLVAIHEVVHDIFQSWFESHWVD